MRGSENLESFVSVFLWGLKFENMGNAFVWLDWFLVFRIGYNLMFYKNTHITTFFRCIKCAIEY